MVVTSTIQPKFSITLKLPQRAVVPFSGKISWQALCALNYAVGRTGEVPAATGPYGKGGVSQANYGKAGSVTNPKICQRFPNKLRGAGQSPVCSTSNHALRASVQTTDTLWAFPISGLGEFDLACCAGAWRHRSRLASVYLQNWYQGRFVVPVSAVCIIIDIRRSISCCWASTRACRASTRALWFWLFSCGKVSTGFPSTATIHCPFCLCAATVPALMRLRTVSVLTLRCSAASFIEQSIGQSIGHVPMQVAHVAYAGFGQMVAA